MHSNHIDESLISLKSDFVQIERYLRGGFPHAADPQSPLTVSNRRRPPREGAGRLRTDENTRERKLGTAGEKHLALFGGQHMIPFKRERQKFSFLSQSLYNVPLKRYLVKTC